MAARLLLLVLLASTASGALGSILPYRLGPYTRGNVSPVPILAADREIYDEYGLRDSQCSAYRSSAGRTMAVDAFRFVDSEGGYAAYLWLRPLQAVKSPLDERVSLSGYLAAIHADVGGGVTVATFKNYVFRFRGATPDSSAFEQTIATLPALDAAEPSPDLGSHDFDSSSERALAGPASLARFAGRIPPSIAALRLGARGRIARFETPAGSMSRIVFEYPAEAVAQARAAAFRAVPGALVGISGRRVAVIFDPIDRETARHLLRDMPLDPSQPAVIAWDPMTGKQPFTMYYGIAMTLIALALGSIVAVFRFLARSRDGIQDRTTSLHL
jgi:hypothetical protein